MILEKILNKERKYKIFNCLGGMKRKTASEMSKEDILNTSREYARKFANIKRPTENYAGDFSKQINELVNKGVEDPTNLQNQPVKFKGEYNTEVEYERIFGKTGKLKGMNWQEAIDNGAANLGWRGTWKTHDRTWISHSKGNASVVHRINEKPTLEELGLKPRTKIIDNEMPYRKRRERKQSSITPYLK